MESFYKNGKVPPPRWNSGISPEVAENKVNELMLPERHRPLTERFARG
jgi:hypothetical protein